MRNFSISSAIDCIKEYIFAKNDKQMFYNNYKAFKNYSNIISSQYYRRPNFPEYLGENIIKHILQNNGDNTIEKNNPGDLFSRIDGNIECKCFSSNAPISFSPKTNWDSLYILDARDWTNDFFYLYRITLKKNSKDWRNIKVNRKQSFYDQCKQKRRPRIKWNHLYPQVKTNCIEIFKGNINHILS